MYRHERENNAADTGGRLLAIYCKSSVGSFLKCEFWKAFGRRKTTSLEEVFASL
jgi:hypothetical protein